MTDVSHKLSPGVVSVWRNEVVGYRVGPSVGWFCMKRTGRITSVLLAVGILFVMLSLPAFAQDEDEAPEPAPTSEDSGLEPAVPLPDDTPSAVIPDWTYRYMIPITLALAAVVVLLTSIRYFTNVVRKRYRTVEE